MKRTLFHCCILLLPACPARGDPGAARDEPLGALLAGIVEDSSRLFYLSLWGEIEGGTRDVRLLGGWLNLLAVEKEEMFHVPGRIRVKEGGRLELDRGPLLPRGEPLDPHTSILSGKAIRKLTLRLRDIDGLCRLPELAGAGSFLLLPREETAGRTTALRWSVEFFQGNVFSDQEKIDLGAIWAGSEEMVKFRLGGHHDQSDVPVPPIAVVGISDPSLAADLYLPFRPPLWQRLGLARMPYAGDMCIEKPEFTAYYICAGTVQLREPEEGSDDADTDSVTRSLPEPEGNR